MEEVIQNNYVLMPGRYVGTEEEEIDAMPFDEKKCKTLTAKLAEQFAKDNELENTIRENLKGIGYEFNDWDVVRLEELCSKVTSGGTPSTQKEEYYGGNIPWLKTQEVTFNKFIKLKLL